MVANARVFWECASEISKWAHLCECMSADRRRIWISSSSKKMLLKPEKVNILVSPRKKMHVFAATTYISRNFIIQLRLLFLTTASLFSCNCNFFLVIVTFSQLYLCFLQLKLYISQMLTESKLNKPTRILKDTMIFCSHLQCKPVIFHPCVIVRLAKLQVWLLRKVKAHF